MNKLLNAYAYALHRAELLAEKFSPQAIQDYADWREAANTLKAFIGDPPTGKKWEYRRTDSNVWDPIDSDALLSLVNDPMRQFKIVYREVSTPQYSEKWRACCRASGRIADMVCTMYHPGNKKARDTWPTATWAEIIAVELGIELPNQD